MLRPRRSLQETLAGKRVLVTGAASGIGRATALAAARAGAALVLTDIHAGALAAVSEEIAGAGGVVLEQRALDIADYKSVRAMARDIGARHGSLDVLMNIAGIATWGAVDHLEHEQWRRTVEVNLMGPIHVIECFLPPMIAAGRGGHLVNVSSAAGLFGLPLHAPYSATKFGLRGISEVLRFDLRRHRIGVTLVCPGGVDTPLVGTVDIAGVDRTDPAVQRLVARFQRHAVSPERAAEAILEGVRHRRYLVYTSNDIRIGHFIQRKWALPYELAMRALNAHMGAIARRSGR